MPRSIISNFKYSYRAKDAKKDIGTLYLFYQFFFLFVLYCLKAGEPVVQSLVLIHSSRILFPCFSLSYFSLRNKQLERGGVRKV